MFNVLIDTSVWLDLAQDPKQSPLLLIVENMVRDKKLCLIVPRVVHDEFHKNRERVAKASARSLGGHFQQVKDAVNRGTADSRRKKALLAQLDDLNHKIPLIGGAAEGVLRRVDTLLRRAAIVETSDVVKLRAADRALNRKAPCHREGKNSIADAIVLETYFEAVKTGNAGERFAFVTHNKNDFSALNGNHKLPHPDFASQFSKIRSMYFINLAELLRRIDPSTVTELIWEQMWQQEPRSLTEILDAHEILWRQIWYNRHKYREWLIQKGKIKIVPREVWEKGKRDNQNEIIDEVWKGAVRAAKRTERELGKDKIGPWTDFEWGMINGKLSAIRWVFGDEWDMLDT
ncbi:MAG: PIN domain-containing protein [Nitrospiraceae bacterium]